MEFYPEEINSVSVLHGIIKPIVNLTSWSYFILDYNLNILSLRKLKEVVISYYSLYMTSTFWKNCIPYNYVYQNTEIIDSVSICFHSYIQFIIKLSSRVINSPQNGIY